MKLRTYMLAAAAVSMTSVPALAAPVANPAASLSVAKAARASAPSAKKGQLAGGGALIGILAAAAVVAGIVIIANDSDSK